MSLEPRTSPDTADAFVAVLLASIVARPPGPTTTPTTWPPAIASPLCAVPLWLTIAVLSPSWTLSPEPDTSPSAAGATSATLSAAHASATAARRSSARSNPVVRIIPCPDRQTNSDQLTALDLRAPVTRSRRSTYGPGTGGPRKHATGTAPLNTHVMSGPVGPVGPPAPGAPAGPVGPTPV